MNSLDSKAPADRRFHCFRNLCSVFPLPTWNSLDDWKKKRQDIKNHLWLCSGLNDQTKAFKPTGHIIKTFEHHDITVENISIETLPELYVQGNLYKPQKFKGKLALILNPHVLAEHAYFPCILSQGGIPAAALLCHGLSATLTGLADPSHRLFSQSFAVSNKEYSLDELILSAGKG